MSGNICLSQRTVLVCWIVKACCGLHMYSQLKTRVMELIPSFLKQKRHRYSGEWCWAEPHRLQMFTLPAPHLDTAGWTICPTLQSLQPVQNSPELPLSIVQLPHWLPLCLTSSMSPFHPAPSGPRPPSTPLCPPPASGPRGVQLSAALVPDSGTLSLKTYGTTAPSLCSNLTSSQQPFLLFYSAPVYISYV